MTIKITEVKTKSQLEEYLKVPAAINKDNKIFVPPLYTSEYAFHNPDKNPHLKQSDSIKFLAFENKKCVGRIMGIIFHPWNLQYNKKTARFYQIDHIKSMDVCNALMDEVEEWAKSKGMNDLVGPLGFSDRKQQGLLIEGINDLPVWEASCQITHVPLFVHRASIEIWYDLFSYQINIPQNNPEFLIRIKERTINRGEYKLINFKTKEELMPWIEPMRELINSTYKDTYGYCSIDENEMFKLIHGFLPILDVNFIKAVVDSKSNLAAFVIAQPNIGVGLQKCNGHINLINKHYIQKALKKSKRLDLLLGAVDNKSRGIGLDAFMTLSLFDEARKKGITAIDSNIIHESNRQLRLEALKLGGKHYKMYRVFGKKINAKTS